MTIQHVFIYALLYIRVELKLIPNEIWIQSQKWMTMHEKMWKCKKKENENDEREIKKTLSNIRMEFFK